MKKDNFHGKLAFFFSLGFWVPLFNIGLAITSIVLAIMSLKKSYQDPKHFDGRGYAAVALVLSISTIILSILGIVTFLLSDRICLSALCTGLN